MKFFEQVEARAFATGSLLCVGLDPHEADLAEQTGDAAYNFCVNIIEKTAPFAVAFKPNAAFFERLGPSGLDALKRVVAAVPEGIPVVLDAKRGDISSTAGAYASSAYEYIGAGSVTLSPYMGSDSVRPFLDEGTWGSR
jgi:uridine monophosphate synthetase